MRAAPRTVTLSPRLQGDRGVSRVTCDVEGVPIWFETGDAELAAAPEGFGSALMIPLLHHRARMRLPKAVSATWARNAGEAVALLNAWWRYPRLLPETPAQTPAGRAAAPSTALFFSGGVDSFHILLHGAEPVDTLITLIGFDFRVDDQARVAAVEASVRAVAGATGKRSIVVRTNVREHPLVRSTPWERAHAAVMGGVAHLLAPTVGRVVMAASAPGDWHEMPYGSHWRLDPLWSSERTICVHEGRGSRRIDKLRGIAASPLIRDHLRVCWFNITPTGNCSRCAKCMLAMLVLESCGELEHSTVFEHRDALVRNLRARRRGTKDRFHSFAELAESPRLDPELAAEARRIVRLSLHARRPDVRARRALIGWWLGLVRRPAAEPRR